MSRRFAPLCHTGDQAGSGSSRLYVSLASSLSCRSPGCLRCWPRCFRLTRAVVRPTQAEPSRCSRPTGRLRKRDHNEYNNITTLIWPTTSVRLSRYLLPVPVCQLRQTGGRHLPPLPALFPFRVPGVGNRHNAHLPPWLPAAQWIAVPATTASRLARETVHCGGKR